MRMIRLVKVIALLLTLRCLSSTSVAQTLKSSPTDEDYKQRTPYQTLRAKGINPSPQALIIALGSEDPLIRTAAAYEVASIDLVSAVPALKVALEHEKDKQTELHLTEALFHFKDPEAKEHIEPLCQPQISGIESVLATSRSFALMDPKATVRACGRALVDIAKTDKNAMNRSNALENLAVIRSDMPPELATATGEAAEANLSSPEPYLRVSAARAIRADNSPRARDLLAQAIGREGDARVRSLMRTQLEDIRP